MTHTVKAPDPDDQFEFVGEIASKDSEDPDEHIERLMESIPEGECDLASEELKSPVEPRLSISWEAKRQRAKVGALPDDKDEAEFHQQMNDNEESGESEEEEFVETELKQRYDDFFKETAEEAPFSADQFSDSDSASSGSFNDEQEMLALVQATAE